MPRSRFFDLTGQVFGLLSVVEPASVQQRGSYKWKCLCQCGNESFVNSANLRNGTTNSCGCLRKEISSQRFKTHGRTRSPTYRIWSGMRTRCNNPKSSNYLLYGGRGIKICDRWSKFEMFLEDMGERPHGKSLDRIDVNGNYEPSNCRWASSKEQSENRRQLIFFNKEKMSSFLEKQNYLTQKQKNLIVANLFAKNKHK